MDDTVKQQEKQRQIREKSLKQMKDTNKYVTICRISRNNDKLNSLAQRMINEAILETRPLPLNVSKDFHTLLPFMVILVKDFHLLN